MPLDTVMGKGGTKYVADAKAARTGTRRSAGSSRQKELEKFLETGKLPRHSTGGMLPQLPVSSKQRPHVFLDFEYAGKRLARIVVEVFDDIVPAAGGFFISRCVHGSSQPLLKTKVHKVLSGLAVYGGERRGGELMRIKQEETLRHVDGGLVSVSLDGGSYALTIARALHMDEDYQVVGRVRHGEATVRNMADVPVKADDSPVKLLHIVKCGVCDDTGTEEYDVSDGKRKIDEEDHAKVLDASRQGVLYVSAEMHVFCRVYYLMRTARCICMYANIYDGKNDDDRLSCDLNAEMPCQQD